MSKKSEVVAELKKHINPEKAAFFPRFFKTGPGEYGEGDKFLGVVVPDQRKIAKKFKDLSGNEVRKLLDDKHHECRLTAVLILVLQYEKGDETTRQKVVDLYLDKIERINNWDIVDSSAHKILGPHLQDSKRKLLHDFSKTNHLWKQRIAMMTTLHFIKQGDFVDTLIIAKRFLNHEHDLIHKVTGWMLREMGKIDEIALRDFLRQHASKMPRTMLRYAIEKLPEKERKRWLAS